MRLVAVRVGAFSLRFTQPLITARGSFESRPGVLLELRDGDGCVGYGEAAPWPGFGAESAEVALAVLQRAEMPLCGADLEPDELSDALTAHLRHAPAARGALNGALWDLAARHAGQPLCERLAATAKVSAGPVLSRLPVGMLLTTADPAALRAQAADARAAGYRAAKLKLGAVDLADDLARASAAREGLGPGLLLRGDANGAWNPAQAAKALAALAEHDFDYVEQPLAAHDLEGLARLRRDSPVRIAADESVATGAGIEQLLEARAADVLILKPALLGGPGRALNLAGRAQAAGCQVVFTHTFESAVGARHALHCAAAWGDPAAVHGLATGGLFKRDFGPPLVCDRGEIAVPDGPGLGIEVRGLVP